MNREQKKQQTRSRLLETAGRLFKEHQYENVSTRDIAKASGVAIGTLFAHFPDKQLLTQALLHVQIDDRLQERLVRAQQETTGLGFFLNIAEFFYQYYEEDRQFSSALLRSVLFDVGFFQQQMDGFIQQVSQYLTRDFPALTQPQCDSIAKAWFGFYIFQLLTGLAIPESQSDDWLRSLKQECETLASCVAAA